MVDAVVLAGGRIPDEEVGFSRTVGTDRKCMVPLRGRPMVGWVVDALRSTASVRRVAVVGPSELAGHPEVAAADLVLPEAEGRSENLFRGLDAFGDSERVLMATADIPLATGPMYAGLITGFPPDTDLGYTVVRAETVLSAYADRPPPPPKPDGRQDPNWVTVRLREGAFTGTPCLLFRPDAVRRIRPLVKSVFDDRQVANVIRTLRPLLGVWLLVRIALTLRFRGLGWMASMRGIERRIGRSTGLVARCNTSPHAELAFDVDHLTDVPIAERVLGARTAPQHLAHHT